MSSGAHDDEHMKRLPNGFQREREHGFLFGNKGLTLATKDTNATVRLDYMLKRYTPLDLA